MVEQDYNLSLPKKYYMQIGAPIHKRALAFLIDFLILDFVVFSTTTQTLKNVLPDSLSFSQSLSFLQSNSALMNKLSVLLVINAGLMFSYFYYTQKNFSQTIGMRILKLYVEPIKKQGRKEEGVMKSWQVIVRNLYMIPIFPLFILFFIDVAYLLLYNNRFSEKISNTQLVEEHEL
ncbi:RDD family protein [Candidatus Woesearchaeota archaeon]|nr:RDD family protein [Candidatus Woesearchaeota archaeon]